MTIKIQVKQILNLGEKGSAQLRSPIPPCCNIILRVTNGHKHYDLRRRATFMVSISGERNSYCPEYSSGCIIESYSGKTKIANLQFAVSVC
jgi:hypothetical protein